MARVIDLKTLNGPNAPIPGLKPPVIDFAPMDDSDPADVDAFNEMVRQLRHQGKLAGAK